MDIIRNAETIISLICGIGSLVTFICVRREKKECMKIKYEMNHTMQMKKESEIKSKDYFNIDRVGTFDNRKSIQ